MPDIEYPDLPDTWGVEWESRRAAYYTRWFGTRHAENGYEGVISSDGLQTHSVQIFPILAVREDGDLDVSEVPEANKTYSTEAAAVAAVPELIRELERI